MFYMYYAYLNVLNVVNGAKRSPANIVIKDPLPEHIPRGPWTERESYQVV